jgi:hypothetical protein
MRLIISDKIPKNYIFAQIFAKNIKFVCFLKHFRKKMLRKSVDYTVFVQIFAKTLTFSVLNYYTFVRETFAEIKFFAKTWEN